MKLVVDMNLSPGWVEALSTHGIEAVHWSAVGQPNATDKDVMSWAAANRHLVLTHDLDFSALLAATGASTPSVIQLRGNNVLPEAALKRVVAAIRQASDDLEVGAIVSVDLDRARIRTLPLR